MYNMEDMNEILLVCIVLLTIAAIIAVIYFVIAMNQISQTTKKLEETLTKVNGELDSMHKISCRVLEVADFLPKSWMKVATTVVPFVTSLILKKKK